jgi:hypothetical protein
VSEYTRRSLSHSKKWCIFVRREEELSLSLRALHAQPRDLSRATLAKLRAVKGVCVCARLVGAQQRRFIAARHSFSLPLTDSSVLYPFIIISRELTERRAPEKKKPRAV